MRPLVLCLFALAVALAARADVAPPPLKTSADVQRLRATRLDAAARAYADALARLKMGTATVDSAYQWSQRWRDADSDKTAAAQKYLDRAKLLEGLVRERVATGTMPAGAQFEAAWWRAEAELAVAAAE